MSSRLQFEGFNEQAGILSFTGPATTLPVKGIAKRCLILIFAVVAPGAIPHSELLKQP